MRPPCLSLAPELLNGKEKYYAGVLRKSDFSNLPLTVSFTVSSSNLKILETVAQPLTLCERSISFDEEENENPFLWRLRFFQSGDRSGQISVRSKV
jgi:hypothetical protein